MALCVWAVFGQTVHYAFVTLDDEQYVYENAAITRGLDLKGVVWAFTHVNLTEWWPLTAISHMADWQLYGTNAGGHHLTNVLLHAVAAILLFLLFRSMTGAFWRSAFVAALFAVHPLRVESVAWVTGRKDILSGSFFVLTLWAYTRYARTRRRGPRPEQNAAAAIPAPPSPLHSPFYWLSLLLFALGLLSKSVAVLTVPFVLLLLDHWPLKRSVGWGRLALEKLPFLLLSVAAGLVTIFAQQENLQAGQSVPFLWRCGNALVSYVVYIREMIYPVGLAAFAFFHQGVHLSIWKIAVSSLVMIAISAGVWAGRHRHPWLLVGWLWYLGMMVPVIGILRVGSEARADRYTYLPQVGLCLLVAWGATELCGAWRHRRVALALAASVALASLVGVARAQTEHWRDTTSLWTHALAFSPDNYSAHNCLGIEMERQGRLGEAMYHYERALQINPNYAEAHNEIGIVLAKLGKWDDAIQRYEQALRLKPKFAEARNNLGMAYAMQERVVEARRSFEQALEIKPDFADAHNNLGILLAKQDQMPRAEQEFERALELKPDYAEAHNDLGMAYAAEGRLDEAIQHFEHALRVKPELVAAHNNAGMAYASQGRSTDAIRHFQEAVEFVPDYAEAHFNLGKALSAAGRSPEAIQHFQQALSLATTQNSPALVDSIRAHMKSPGAAADRRGR